jgi:hypothetical protein
MKFQLLHRAVKGAPVVSLNTVTRVVFIFGSSLDRSTTPAFSPPPPPLAPLAFAALSPPQPCSSPAPPLPAWRRWWGCGYWRADVRPTNLKTIDAGSVDVIPGHDDEPAASGHEPTWIRPLRPSREQLLHSRQRLVLLEPPQLSHRPPKSTIYSCQYRLIRETCLDSSSLIDWLWIWWMDFVAPSLFQ